MGAPQPDRPCASDRGQAGTEPVVIVAAADALEQLVVECPGAGRPKVAVGKKPTKSCRCAAHDEPPLVPPPALMTLQ
jgi:hypothetical protein